VDVFTVFATFWFVLCPEVTIPGTSIRVRYGKPLSFCAEPRIPIRDRFGFRYRQHWEPILSFPFRHADTSRSAAWVLLTGGGVGSEQYLHRGWSTSLHVEFGVNLLECPVQLNRYTGERLVLSVGFDLFRLRPTAAMYYWPWASLFS
jgi:hypothetical protein